MNIVLISPPGPKKDRIDPSGFPLGLASIAASVRDKAEIRIIDAYSGDLSIENTVREALEFTPDIVGIGIPFSFIEKNTLEIAKNIKSKNPGIFIVLGGLHATVGREKSINDKSIDAIAIGEAEITFAETIDKFLSGGWEDVRNNPPIGLCLKNSGAEIISVLRPLMTDLDTLPFPAFDLVAGFPENYNARIETSRGCAFSCPYCASCAYWGGVFRSKSTERVIDEIRFLKEKWHVNRISIVDDNFNHDPKRARTLAEKVISENLKVEWGVSCRVDFLTRDDIDLFVHAGMTGLFLGLESGSPEILKSLKRGHDLEKTKELIRYAVEKGVEVHASFMIGLPDEKSEDVELTLKYARDLSASSIGFHIFHPLPGSEYGENPEKYGMEFVSERERWDLGTINSIAPIKTRHMGSNEILDYYYRARGIAASKKRPLVYGASSGAPI